MNLLSIWSRVKTAGHIAVTNLRITATVSALERTLEEVKSGIVWDVIEVDGRKERIWVHIPPDSEVGQFYIQNSMNNLYHYKMTHPISSLLRKSPADISHVPAVGLS